MFATRARLAFSAETQGVTAIEDESVDIRRYIAILLGNWWLLLLLTAVGASVAFVYSRSQDTVYEATARLLVQWRGGGFVVGTSDFTRSAQLASTYRTLVTTGPFLERVAQNNETGFGSGDLRATISASADQNPPILKINARHSDPEVAASVAQLVAEEFIIYTIEQRLGEIARLQTAAAAQGITNVENLLAEVDPKIRTGG